MSITKNCLTCGKEFQCKKSDLAHRKYCSNDCRYRARKGTLLPQAWRRVTKNCPACGKPFEVKRYQAKIRKYCSITCRKVKLVCPICNKEFFTTPSEIKKGRKYCSRNCYKITAKGRKHPPRSKEWREKKSQEAKQRIGEKNPFYGKHHSPETKKIIGELARIRYTGSNNPFFGKHHSEETKRKLSEAHIGKKCPPRSEEYRMKLSKAFKGRKMSLEARKKNSESHKKYFETHEGINKGKKFSLETINKIRLANIGKKHSLEARKKMSEARKGKKFSEEHKIKLGLSKIGEKNHAWLGGKSFEPYNPTFNNLLRKKIWKRDNYTCQKCGKKERLSVHHIDYNKHNDNENNHITLCVSCNVKVNKNREYWKNHFQKKIFDLLVQKPVSQSSNYCPEEDNKFVV